MNLDHPVMLIASCLLGAIGYGFFSHGRKDSNVKTLVIGLTLMVAPSFITSLWADLALLGGSIAALYLLPSSG